MVVEYAKRDVDDVLIRISVTNRGRASAPLHSCRNGGFATSGRGAQACRARSVREAAPGGSVLIAEHATLGKR